MKRNQFFLAVIRLLAKAVFFYVLGASVAKYESSTEKLLVDVDNTIVSVPTYDEIDEYCNSVITIDDLFQYTQENLYGPVMNAAYIILDWKTSVERIRGSYVLVESTQKYDNFLLDKPPRCDLIIYNTS